jgi:hypothetical protein
MRVGVACGWVGGVGSSVGMRVSRKDTPTHTIRPRPTPTPTKYLFLDKLPPTWKNSLKIQYLGPILPKAADI